MQYALGWVVQTFADGRQLIGHGGGIDGFSSKVGFFPADQIGYVVLCNQEPGRHGSLFTRAIEAHLISRLYGLNAELPEAVAGLAPGLTEQAAALAARMRPVDPTAAAPWLGLYEQGFSVRLDASGALHLAHDIRSMPLVAMDDGSYLVAAGPGVIVEHTVTFATDANNDRVMSIAGFDPVRWLTGS